MITTAKIICKGKEALPAGTIVNIRKEKGKLSWGTILGVSAIPPAGLGDLCQLILDDGGAYEIVIKDFGKKGQGGLVITFVVNNALILLNGS